METNSVLRTLLILAVLVNFTSITVGNAVNEPFIFVRRFLQTSPPSFNWLHFRPILIHASPGHRLLESRTNSAVLDASAPHTNHSSVQSFHDNPYNKRPQSPSNFLTPFFERFTILPASQETPAIIPTGSQKSFNRYAQMIPVRRVGPAKIKRAQPKMISASGLNRLVPLIDTRNLDSIEMDFDKDFEKIMTAEFQPNKAPSGKHFFSRNDHNSISGTEDEPFSNDLESFFSSF